MATATAAQRRDVKEYIFVWEGFDRNNRQVRGEARAASETVVTTNLRRQGVRIVKIKRQTFRGDSSVNELLTLSQVVLALQLPFAMFPLLHFTSSRKRMGKWRNGWFLLATRVTSAILITAMDVYGLPDSLKTAWQVVVGE